MSDSYNLAGVLRRLHVSADSDQPDPDSGTLDKDEAEVGAVPFEQLIETASRNSIPSLKTLVHEGVAMGHIAQIRQYA